MLRPQLTIAIFIVFCVFCVDALQISWQSSAKNTPVQIQSGHINLSGWNTKENPAIALNGQWRFFPDQIVDPGDLQQRSASATLMDVPGSWNHKVSPQAFPYQGQGVGTYWLSISGLPQSKQIALTLNRSCSNANVFFFPGNQHYATPLTSMGLAPASAYTASAYSGMSHVQLPIDTKATYNLLIQVSDFDFFVGGLCSSVVIGTEQTLERHLLKSVFKQTLLIAVVIVAALYPLALFMQHRKKTAPLWLAIGYLSTGVFFFTINGFIELFLPSHFTWIGEFRTKLLFITLCWACTALLMFYHCRFPNIAHRLLVRFSLWSTSIGSVAIAFTPVRLLLSATAGFVGYWVLLSLLSFWILMRAFIKKLPHTNSMLMVFTLLLISIPIDVISQSGIKHLPVISIYCFILFIIVKNRIFANDFYNVSIIADNLSKDLQYEVALKTAELNKQNKQLERKHIALRTANHSLARLSITDSLTQLYNRMYFDQEFDKEWRRGSRQKSHLSVLLIDVDYFKKLNDSAGHLAGDDALRLVSKNLKMCFKRAGELVARFGGEEFAVILPNTDSRMALNSAEHVRQVIESLNFVYRNKAYTITVSIGIGTLIPSSKFRSEALLQSADSALYEAKNNGRNRVSIMPVFPSYNDKTKRQ